MADPTTPPRRTARNLAVGSPGPAEHGPPRSAQPETEGTFEFDWCPSSGDGYHSVHADGRVGDLAYATVQRLGVKPSAAVETGLFLFGELPTAVAYGRVRDRMGFALGDRAEPPTASPDRLGWAREHLALKALRNTSEDLGCSVMNEIADEVQRTMSPRDELDFLAELIVLANSYACLMVNRVKPPEAPDVSGPRQPHPDYAKSDVWTLCGWAITRTWDSGALGAFNWSAPDGSEYRLLKDGSEDYLSAEVANSGRDIDDGDWQLGWQAGTKATGAKPAEAAVAP